MVMNPSLAQQLVADRMDDLEHAAQAHGRFLTSTSAATAAPRSPRGALAIRSGRLLIAVGRRLAGPDVASTPLDAAHLGHRHSPA
jgi:hypothetical protein